MSGPGGQRRAGHASGPVRALVLSASVGAGHVRAAQALESALAGSGDGCSARHVDVLSLANPLFRRIYGRGYLDLVNHAPTLVRLLYDRTDAPPDPFRAGARLRGALERASLPGWARLLGSPEWDVVVCTHFLPGALAAGLCRAGLLRVPWATVVTDFDAHGMWVNQPCDRYFVASTEAAASLAHWGVPCERIEATGIPVHPAPASPGAAPDPLREAGLSDERGPLVLLMAGGFGVGPIRSVFESLLGLPVRLLALCGRNQRVRAELSDLVRARGAGPRAAAIGFTSRVPDLLALSTLVVSKPGGLTVSECLAAGVPLAVMHPIPGQEERNADFLLERGCAIKLNGPGAVAAKVAALLADPARLRIMAERARAEGRPLAAQAVAARVCQMARAAMLERAVSGCAYTQKTALTGRFSLPESGGKGTRTPDLFHAMEALYQN